MVTEWGLGHMLDLILDLILDLKVELFLAEISLQLFKYCKNSPKVNPIQAAETDLPCINSRTGSLERKE